MKSSARAISLTTTLLLVGCFDFDRRLDPCGFDPNSDECLNGVDGGMGGEGSGGSGAQTGGNSNVGGGAAVGGAPAGGAASGGAPSGGSAGSGGSNSGGSGGSNPVNVRLVVNEIFGWGAHWVEIYNAGTETATLDGVVVLAGTSGPSFQNQCPLGSGTLAPGAFLVAQDGVNGCELSAGVGATVYLYADGASFHERKIGNETTTPAAGQSWYALVDGGNDFTVGDASKGVSNQ